MVGITIQCRLGNQFFQYFFIRALSEKHNTGFFINQSLDKFLLSEYFLLSGYNPLKNLINKILFKSIHTQFWKKISNVEIGEFNNAYKDLKGLENNKSYGGYFQSENFFTTLKKPISSYIRLKPELKKSFNKKYGYLFKKETIVVHVRRGDYLNLNDWWLKNLGSSDLTLPKEYYLQCLNGIENLNGYNIIFISDDIDYIQREFKDIENKNLINGTLIEDFQILMNADICILSNSSYSWWGAYLNNKVEKQIYCPKYWLGFKIHKEYPKGIIPQNWSQIEINS